MLKTMRLWCVAVLLVAAGGCDDADLACYDGEYLGCRCGAKPGYRLCRDEVYDACVCDGATPGDVEGTGGMGGSDALLPFMSTCESDSECRTDLCHLFSAKGKYCTRRCTSPEDCPLPSSGCNNKGLCKAP